VPPSRRRIPKYRHYKPKNLGVVRLDGKDVYLGKYDWRRVDITFNSLEFSEVNLYLGVWGGTTGRIWWDDLRIEPGGLVNVVRRGGTPLRATSTDGKVRYVEGQDFQGAKDARLGVVRWPGQFTVWHEPPVVTLWRRLRPDSRIHDSQRTQGHVCDRSIHHRVGSGSRPGEANGSVFSDPGR